MMLVTLQEEYKHHHKLILEHFHSPNTIILRADDLLIKLVFLLDVGETNSK